MRPQLFKGEWTPEEDQEIWDRVQEMGTKWAQISEQYMPSRTDNDIKNRWNSVIRKAHAPGGREWEAAENEMRALFLGSASRTQSRKNLGGIDWRRLRAGGEAKKPQSCQSHCQSRPRLPPLAANCLTRRWVSAPMARRCTHPPPHGPSWQTRWRCSLLVVAETIIIERESSGSSSEDDIRDARVYTVRKSHSDTEQAKPPPTPPVEDDPLGDIALLYTIQACLFGHFEPAILSGRVGARD